MLRPTAPTLLRPLAAAAALAFVLALPSSAQVCEGTNVYIADQLRTNYSLGYENFKNEDWCAALPYMRLILEEDPLFAPTGSPDDRNFRRLATTYEELAKTLDDRAQRRVYLDSALAVREMGAETLQANDLAFDPVTFSLWKARFFAEHYNEYPEAQDQVFDLYLEAFRAEPDSLDDYYINEIGRIISTRAAAEQMDAREARDLVDELLEYADDTSYLQQVRETFRVEPIEQWAFLHEAYTGGDRSEDTVKQLFVLTFQLDSMIVDQHPEVDTQTLRSELLPIVAEYNPTPEILIYLGSTAINAGRTDEGLTYFQRAIDSSDDNLQKRDLYYRIANTLYGAGQRSEAYQYAGRALELDSGYGPALYIRALVVSGTLRGGSLANAAGAWCVADMFSRAAAAGGETAGRARQLAGRYAASGPSRDQYFFEGWRPGMTVTGQTGYGSCSTTVR